MNKDEDLTELKTKAGEGIQVLTFADVEVSFPNELIFSQSHQNLYHQNCSLPF